MFLPNAVQSCRHSSGLAIWLHEQRSAAKEPAVQQVLFSCSRGPCHPRRRITEYMHQESGSDEACASPSTRSEFFQWVETEKPALMQFQQYLRVINFNDAGAHEGVCSPVNGSSVESAHISTSGKCPVPVSGSGGQWNSDGQGLEEHGSMHRVNSAIQVSAMLTV